MTLLAAFQTLLMHYSGLQDIVVGTPIANRAHSEIENLIGLFINTLVLRTDLSGNPSFLELLKRVRETTVEAYAHQDVPFEKLVEVLQPERDLSRSPLFQVLFILQNATDFVDNLGQVTLHFLEGERQTTQFDLTLSITDTRQGLRCAVEYDTDLFEPETIVRLLEHWQQLLTSIVAHPEHAIWHLPLLSSAQHAALLASCQGPHLDVSPSELLLARLVNQLAQAPDALVLSVPDEQQLTCACLHQQADALATQLQHQGIRPGQVVALCLPRSSALLIALLAVLKTGATYLPLDPEAPQERLNWMLQQSQATLLLCSSQLDLSWPSLSTDLLDLDTLLPLPPSSFPLIPQSDPELPAYLIYTSGSTGEPKGTLISHGALANLLLAMDEQPGLTSQDVVLALTGLSFDIAVLELLWPLTHSARVYLLSRRDAMEGSTLSHHLQISGATLMQATPSTYRLLLQAGWQGSPHLRLLCGGEAWSSDLAEPLLARCAELWNMYGPTETTVWSLVSQIQEPTVTIGLPIANTQAYVLDAYGTLLPPGIIGELWLGGHGLAQGYLHQPTLTAERFLPDPFSQQPGARLYRTGDLVRRLPSGHLLFLGRADQQIKLRGHRIELGEIESVLLRHAEVKQAVVLLREEHLVAFVQPVAGLTPTTSLLRSHAEQRLPQVMVPTFFQVLEQLPLTPNGKLDRRALAMLPLQNPEHTPQLIQQPADPLEDLVASVWQQVLGNPQLDRDTSFFLLGGHSLLATQVIARLRALLHIELPLRTLFETSTIRTLTRRIHQQLESTMLPPQPSLLPTSRPTSLPLSFGQQRLWFLHQLEPASPWYTLPLAGSLHGRLDIHAFHRSLSALLHRHESLRTTFHQHGDQLEQVIGHTDDPGLICIDLRGLPAQTREQCVHHLRIQEHEQPFDLTHGPLLRPRLLWLQEERWILLLTQHHIITDAWSNRVLLAELSRFYQAFHTGQQDHPLPELTVQYVDYVLWQQQWLQGPVMQRQLAYWTRKLQDAPTLALPTDYPRPAVLPHHGARYDFKLPLSLIQALTRLCQQEDVTLFMLLLGAFQVLLYRLTGQVDIVVGTAVANRTPVETEALIGFFINTLALRIDLAGAPPLQTVLHQVREIVLEAYAHQDVPFEMVIDNLRMERKPNQAPLVQALFLMQNIPIKKIELPGITLLPIKEEINTSKLDLSVSLFEDADSWSGVVTYNTALFTSQTIDTMMKRYEVLLNSIVKSSSDTPVNTLDIYTEEERMQQEKKRSISLLKLKATKKDESGSTH